MKKNFKDNANKTAMQFAKEIISEIKSGETGGTFSDEASESLFKALKWMFSGSLSHLVEDLVNDATGKDVDVSITADQPYEEYEAVCEWRINN